MASIMASITVEIGGETWTLWHQDESALIGAPDVMAARGPTPTDEPEVWVTPQYGTVHPRRHWDSCPFMAMDGPCDCPETVALAPVAAELLEAARQVLHASWAAAKELDEQRERRDLQPIFDQNRVADLGRILVTDGGLNPDGSQRGWVRFDARHHRRTTEVILPMGPLAGHDPVYYGEVDDALGVYSIRLERRDDDDLVTLAEAGRRTGTPYPTLKTWRQRHEDFPGPAVADRLWRLSEIRAWIAKPRPPGRPSTARLAAADKELAQGESAVSG
jgi:hypothetical protein